MRRSGQEDPNNFFTDQMSNVWLGCGARGAQMGAQKGSGALLSIDFRPRPWGGSAASIIMGTFHIFRRAIAPFSLYSAGNGRRNH